MFFNHVPSQVSKHDSGSAAAKSHAKQVQDIHSIRKQAMSKADVAKRLAAAKEDDQKSLAVSTGSEGDTELDEFDLGFSSFAPPCGAATGQSGPAPKRAPKLTRDNVAAASLDNQSKRRRTAEPAGSAPAAAAAEGRFAKRASLPMVPPFSDVSDAPASAGENAKVTKSRTTFVTKKAGFSDELLWEGKMRARAFPSLSKGCEDLASKIIAEPCGGAELAQEILDFPDAAQLKFDIFVQMKKDSAFSLGELSDDQLKMLQNLHPSLLSKIIMHVGGLFLKDIEEKLWAGGSSSGITFNHCILHTMSISYCTNTIKLL